MIDGPTYFAWFVLALLFLVAVGVIVWLGSLPGKIAQRRQHPQADAINALSWFGLLMGGLGWVIAFVWALYRPTEQAPPLEEKVAELESRLAKLESKEK